MLRLLIWSFLFGIAVTSYAGDAGTESPFSVGAGARALAMGGAFTSLADDASAVFYNPAGLSSLQYQEASFMHMSLFEGTVCDFGSWVYPSLSLGGFGAAFMRIGTDDIIRRSNFAESGTFGYSTSQLLLSYGRRLRGGISMGVSLKIVNQTLDVYSDYGVGLDFGMTARLYKNLSAGIMFRDMIPASIKLDTTSELTPLTVYGGISLREISVREDVALALALDLDKVENRSTKLHVGAELRFDKKYFLRMGYDRDNFSFGTGLLYHRLKVDYAYKFLNYIDDSHRFSVSWLIGASIEEQQQRKLQEEQLRGSALLEDERRRQFEQFKTKADTFYEQFRLDSALTYYQRALAFDENNEEIIGTIAAIERIREIQRERERKLRETALEMEQTINNYYTQAKSFFAKKYYAAALDMLNLIFDIDKNHAGARKLKLEIEDAITSEIAVNREVARVAEQEGDYLTAIEAYTRILELDPGNVEIQKAKKAAAQHIDLTRQLKRGIQSFKQGRYGDARQRFGAVLAIDPTEPVALEYIRKIDKALAKPPTLEDIQKDKVIWQLYLDGLRYMRNKEYQKAIEAWEEVLQAYPNNSKTLDNLEQARLRLKSQESE